MSEERMKVVVRVRPLQSREEPWPKVSETDSNPPTIAIQGDEVRWEKNGQLTILKSDAVFANGASQESVYRSVSECVDALVAGFDCSLLAYGQTGTGKTYTMSGLQRDESADVDELGLVPATHGVIPRSIERLFAEIEREKRGAVGTLFSVYCSFIEIYNEKIYDILSPDVPTSGNQSPDAKAAASSGSLTQRSRWNSSTSAKDAKNLPIRQKVDGSVFVDGMTSRNVGSQAGLLQAFCEGSLHREVRDNLYNHFSSRGHAVFQITLRRTVADDESNKTSANKTRLSRLFFVDLAGSEKWHVHGSDLTDKYASELASINKSLSALTNCVMALTQKDRSHVPFRDSALTRLLQPCLQGSGRTAFIVTISPSKGSLEESFATLRFAERLRAIRCRPVRRSLLSSEMLGEQRLYYERQIQAMRVEVNRLRDLLRKASQRPNETTRSSSKDALVEENRRLKELLLQSERSRLVERSERINNKSSKPNGTTVKISPQQFSARQMLKSTLMLNEEPSIRHRPDLQTDNSVNRLDDNAFDSTQKTSTQPRDQLTTLETQLQSKEARLNWMLEAEMEAQNASVDTVQGDPNHRQTVSRSWAVETRLRRQLVAVPSPMRDTQPDPDSGVRGEGKLRSRSVTNNLVVSQRETTPTKRVLPVIMDKPTATSPANSASNKPVLSVSRLLPRYIPSSPSENYLAGQVTTGSRKSRVNAISRSLPVESVTSNSQPEPIKASSILKLVGSSSVDGSGKTRDEIIEEYKRARRVELQTMMRTMVQK